MATEIERKFLVNNDSWRDNVASSAFYRQGYLNEVERCSIRVRIAGDRGFLNIKSATLGIERSEYEYEIPLDDANEMLEKFCASNVIEKTRYLIPCGSHTWELDEFSGDNAGLIVAEIELTAVNERFTKPDWVGEEVSTDARYYNVCLVTHPFKDW